MEKEITLGFEQTDDGPMIVALDKNHKKLYCGNLLTFNVDGSITVHSGVDNDLGFQLDEYQQIKIKYESVNDADDYDEDINF